MANNVNSSFLSTGSQSKPPTLVREEYPQWKVRMINFLEGIHPRISEFLYNPPFVPMDLIPRVPATGTTPEIPEHYEPKSIANWSDGDKELVELGNRCKRLLIMAIPHEIFKNIDHCHLAMDIWAELEKQIEGGTKTLKNNRASCIDEYHSFKAKEGESLSDTYARLNTLISNCKRYGVMRSSEDNNSLFLKSLGYEWMNLTMSMKATLDLEVWTLADLFGSLKSQEPQILQMKKGYGGPLALVSEGKDREPKKEEKEKKKKKVLIAESDESSEDEVSMQEMIKTLALITREYRKGGEKKDYRSFDRRSYRGSERREREEPKNQQRIEEQKKEEPKEGCFKCGKPGHFAAECWSKGPKMSQKGPRDEAFYKKKAEYYQQKSLLAQTSELVTDESSDEDVQKGLFALEDSDAEDDLFCGMAKIDSDPSDLNIKEVSTSSFSESIDLYNEIIDNLDSCHSEHYKFKEKLFFCEKEISLLTEERDRFFKMFKEAQIDFVNLEKSSKEKVAKLEKELQNKVDELRKVEHEKCNVASVKDYFQKEREFLHQDILDRELKIRKFQDAQNVFKKIRVNMGRRGIGFSEFDNKPSFRSNKTLENTFRSSKNLKSNIPDTKSIFKRRRLLVAPDSRTPLIMENVAFEDYIDSFSPSEKKDFIPRNFLRQSQLGIFKFGQPETQEDCAFVCTIRPLERELFSEASEFFTEHITEAVPANSDLTEVSNILCEKVSVSASSSRLQNFSNYAIIDRDLLTSDSEEEDNSDLESESCSEVSMPSSPIYKTCDEFSNGNISEHESISDYEESSTQVVETDIVAHRSVGQEMVNIPITLANKRTGVKICPDFMDMCINIKTSLDLEKIEKEKQRQSNFQSSSSKTQRPKFTWQQKMKWPQTNSASTSVTAGKSKRGSKQKKFKNSFNKEPRLVEESCNEKPIPRKGSKNKHCVPFFDKFNEDFKKFSCNVTFCNCFNIMHALSQHLHHSSCLVTHPKNNGFGMNNRHFGDSLPKKNKTKSKGVVAYQKQANVKGPNWKWVPKANVV